MFLIFDKTTKRILSYGFGTPTESAGKLYLGSEAICNSLTICGWKYIADQKLEQDDTGFVYDADHYEEIAPEPTLQEQIDALVMLMGGV
jgi:hypothetical protein